MGEHLDGRRVYNLFWVYPILVERNTIHPVSRKDTNYVDGNRGFDAVILYPALLTPEIVVGGEAVELLLAAKAARRPLEPWDVHIQLKYSIGMDPEKGYCRDPLIPYERGVSREEQLDKIAQLIRVERVHVDPSKEPLHKDPVLQRTRFTGVIDPRAREVLRARGYTELYWVQIARSCLREQPREEKLNAVDNGRISPQEMHDDVIKVVLDDLRGPQGWRLSSAGHYGFNVTQDGESPGDAVVGSMDYRLPIQAYHPVFAYPKDKGPFNLGHLADLHISSRQQALRRSPARMIDEGDAEDTSAPIGSFVNVCSENVKSILDSLGSDAEVDLILIGGDLIDHLRNWYPSKGWGDTARPTAGDVWYEVSVGDEDYKTRYQDYVDFVSFYTLILHSYTVHEKPMFVVTGNHDAYMENYGISPRLYLLGTTRANEGIPQDHNLSIYEAITAFGDSYPMLRKYHGTANALRLGYIGLFEEAYFKWFYTVLTPFADFAAHLPGQSLVGLAWGGSEDLLDVPPCGHGLGFLPRSNDGVSDMQLEIIEDAAARPPRGRAHAGRKVLLMTHFTFVSYRESVPFYRWVRWTGDKEPTRLPTEALISKGDNYGPHDMGTFETHRAEVYSLVAKGTIQCVLTGHSHRRGVYPILGEDDSSVRVASYDFPDLPASARKGAGLIVVSDSAGSIPRHSRFGEFGGHGSDTPSGTKVVFDPALWQVDRIEAVPSKSPQARPRLSVTLDYYDLFHKLASTRGVFDHLASDYIDEVTDGRAELTFVAPLSDGASVGIQLREMSLYLFDPMKQGDPKEKPRPAEPCEQRWTRIGFEQVKGLSSQLVLSGEDEGRLRKLVRPDVTAFLSVRFRVGQGGGEEMRRVLERYNLDTPWIFLCRVEVKRVTHITPSAGGTVTRERLMYTIKRDLEPWYTFKWEHDVEVPDLEWRKKSFGKYARSEKAR